LLDERSIPRSVRLRSYAFDRFGAAAAVLDGSGVIVETNEAWRLFAALNEAAPGTTDLGVSYVQVCDRALASGVESAGVVARGLRSILRGERSSFEIEYPCPSAIEDRWFVLHAAAAPVHDGAGIVLFHVNVTSRKLLEVRLGAAYRDGSSGLTDRRAGMRLIENGLERAVRLETRLTIIKVSVDGLGMIDHEFGAPAVDEIMVQVNARALRVLRADDDVGRLGSGDFVIVCDDLDDESAAAIVDRLDDAIAAPFQFGAHEVALGVHVGVASNVPGSTAIALLAAVSAGDSVETRAVRRAEQQSRAAVALPRDIQLPLSGDAGSPPLEIARAQRDAVLAHSNDMVMYLDPDGTIAWASPAIRTLTGIDPMTVVGRSGFDLIHPDDRDRALTELGTIAGIGQHATCEHRVITDDGAVRWVEETATDLIDDPYVGYIVVNLRDITERKQYELVQARLSAIVESSTAAIVSTALDGTVQTWNEAAVELYGYRAEEIVGRAIALTIPADRVDELHEQLDIAVSGGQPPAGLETRGLRADGSQFDASVTISAIRDGDGCVIASSRVIRDISEQVGLRRSLEIDRRRLADAQRSAHLGSFELDDSTHTMTWSAELGTILGLGTDAVQSPAGFRARVHPDDRASVDVMLAEAARGGPTQGCTHRIVHPDGEIRWVAARAEAPTDVSSAAVAGTLLDITDRKQLELNLWEQATHDGLTGLANRFRLLEQLGAALSDRDGGRTRVGVLLFDVDRFKLVNDSLGHDRGDQLLVAIAGALLTILEQEQTAARVDSDSFAVVIPRLASAAAALEIANRIRARLAQGLTIGADHYRSTVSIGMVITQPGDTPITALRDAETAMYRAKEQGRDRAEWFDPGLHKKVIATFEMERDLRRAIELDQMYLVFQPVLDLETGEIASCEALVRWQHPERGVLNPDDFIPVAENTGLIVPLGRWVLPHALAIAGGWPDGTQVAVNLSAAELAQPDLVAFVEGTLGDLAVPASRLVFEITETAVIHDPTAAARTIAALRNLGVSVVIDDFGTGYTSLAFLRDYRIDGLKIDRSFVTDLALGSTAIVDAMIRMSAALDLEVIAEGIETVAQLEQLRHLGCRFIQGYLISKPVAANDIPFEEFRTRSHVVW
jgi:diguanylate cyclase (GGDEF)-like protein/PAS domain S-box-containing protein